MGAPLVVSYGGGTNSTALLVGLYEHSERPDAIVMADTGGEKPRTIAYLDVLDAWLARVGFPTLTRVRYVSQEHGVETLEASARATARSTVEAPITRSTTARRPTTSPPPRARSTRSSKGLGSRFNWRELADADVRQQHMWGARMGAIPCDCYDGGDE